MGPVRTRARHWPTTNCRDARKNEFGTGRAMVGVCSRISCGDGRVVMKTCLGSRGHGLMYRCALPKKASSLMRSRSCHCQATQWPMSHTHRKQISPLSLILRSLDCWNASRATYPCRNTSRGFLSYRHIRLSGAQSAMAAWGCRLTRSARSVPISAVLLFGVQ